MKNFYIGWFFLFPTSLISCDNKVSVDELTLKKGDIVQYKGKPYTGSVFESFPNGDIRKEGQYRDGLKVGKFVEYYENKQIREEKNYIINSNSEGILRSYPDGEFKSFFENGNLLSIQRYISGKQDGLQEYFNQNGYKCRILNYKDGLLEGEQLSYQCNGPEGVLEEKSFYKSGKKEGEYLQYRNGILRIKRFFNEGNLIGVEEIYDEQGVLEDRIVH